MQSVRQYIGRFVPSEPVRSDKDRAQELFERAAQFRSMAREIMALADEAEAEAMTLIGSSPEGQVVSINPNIRARDRLSAAAKNQYRSRRLRERSFDGKMFGEPAWDMLLELFAAELNGERISTSNLILSSAAPSSTALRWLKYLERLGLVSKIASHVDGRVQYQRMTSAGMDSMTKYFEKMPGI